MRTTASSSDLLSETSGGVRRRVLGYSIASMTVIALVVGAIAIASLYDTAVDQEAKFLADTARTQARLIESVARFERGQSAGEDDGEARQRTLTQIVDAHRNTTRMGETGELLLGQRERDEIVFLLERMQSDGLPERVPYEGSELAEPMRRALSGQSGTMRGIDHRGEVVLAAYEPVAELDLGLVAKIDLDEVRRPFLIAGLIDVLIGLCLVFGGAYVMVRVNDPLIRKVERREAQFRDLLETAPDAMLIIDDRLEVVRVNAAAERMFGSSRDDLIGMPSEELVSRTAGLARRRDGGDFPVEVTLGRMEAASGFLTSLAIRDITERRRFERELDEARAAAESASHAKSAFLANMSHELRTPMNAILGYSEMLIEDAEDEGETSSIPDLRRIHTAGEQLLLLIDGVLDLSKIEAGRVDLFLETVSVAALVRTVADTVQPLASKNGNDLLVECGDDAGSIHTDVTKVRQSLLNLLSNAAKFTEGGRITLSVGRDATEERIRFVVEDTGIGIPPERIESLFEEFTQADASTTRNYGGTGLGLAISRRFCRLMGGDITAESEVGAGSTFTIDLPVRAVEPPDGVAETDAAE